MTHQLLLIVTLVFIASGCTVQDVNDNPIPAWEAAGELRKIQGCTHIIDLCWMQVSHVEDPEKRLKIFHECDLALLRAGCSVESEGENK